MRRYRLSYFIGQGFKGLWDNRMMCLASIFILTFCLNIMGAFVLLIHNLDHNIDKLGDLNRISAFVEAKDTFRAGEKITLPENLKADADAQGQTPTFLGWSLNALDIQPQFDANADYTLLAEHSVCGEIRLYAVWSDTVASTGCSVLYSFSGVMAEDDLPVDQGIYNIGDQITMPEEPEAHYADISFLGWSTDPRATEGLGAGAAYTVTQEDMARGAVVIYAIWSEESTISEDVLGYDRNGCPIDITAIRLVYDSNGKTVQGDMPTIDQGRLAAIEAKIRSLANVKDVTLISKEQALDEEMEKYQDYPNLVEDMYAGENPYRDMFYISYEDNALVDNLVHQLNEIDELYNVKGRVDYASNIDNLKTGIVLIFVWFLALIFLFSVLIIVNTVKLNVYSRREEIGIMSYVGATPFFISFPYVFEGILIGIISGSVAFLTSKLLYSRVAVMISSDFHMISVVPFGEMSNLLLIGFFAVGIFTGILGSCISLKRYMNN